MELDLEHVHIEEGERSITLTLDHPPLNVLSLEVIRELDRALEHAGARTDLPVLVLRATGERAFSAGVAVEDHVPERIDQTLEAFHRVIRTLWSLDQVVLAVVQADALGGGLELVAACDLVLAAAGSRLGQPEIDLGCFPPVAAALLPRRIGHQRTCELLFLGRPLTAERVREFGLVNWVVPGEEIDDRCAEIVAELGGKSGAVLRMARRAILVAEEAGWRKALDRTEGIYLRQLAGTVDMAEGVSAFLEKREPEWRDE